MFLLTFLNWDNLLKNNYNTTQVSAVAPFPQIDIGAMMIVWKVKGKIIRSVLCSIVCSYCAQCNAHIYERTNLTVVLVRFSFSVVMLCFTVYQFRLSFFGLFCYSLCAYVCFCCVTFSFFSTMPRYWLGRTCLWNDLFCVEWDVKP